MKKEYESVFSKQAGIIAGHIINGIEKLSRADLNDSDIESVLGKLEMNGWAILINPTEEILNRIHVDGSTTAFAQIGFAPDDAMTSLMSERARRYAETRGAELVGMKNIGTKQHPTWIENPDRQWAITDSTRDMLRVTVRDAVQEGKSMQKLRNEIIDNYAFSADRAEMIARTEVAFADSNGNMEAYRESGMVEGKEWILASGHEDDDECNENEEAGVIPLDEPFPDGSDCAPAHPNCECDVLPVLAEVGT